MRRLPVYLLLDTSGSMYGEPIEAVKNGVQVLVSTLRQDPYALETAYLSIITFDSSAKQVTPLTELAAFQQPTIEANGCTALGEALGLLAQKVDTEVTKTTAEVKGDWKPLVFIMTDGVPTDDINKGLVLMLVILLHASSKFVQLAETIGELNINTRLSGLHLLLKVDCSIL